MFLQVTVRIYLGNTRSSSTCATWSSNYSHEGSNCPSRYFYYFNSTLGSELIVTGPRVEIVDSPIPKPNADQVLIKVVVSGSNPKDWKVPEWQNTPQNSGDDIAGIVEAVGDNITEFHPGDRVAAFHEMFTPHGSFAEYAISWGHTTFHLPKNVTFEEAATIPLAAMTAALGIYIRLGLPQPWQPAREQLPLVVYGASGAVGAYAIKFARLSNIHPIIAVAGKGAAYVETLIDRSKGDNIIDYRKGDSAVVSGIKDALIAAGASGVHYAFDGVSEKGSYQNLSKVLGPSSKLTLVLQNDKEHQATIPSHIEWSHTHVGGAHAELSDANQKLGIPTGSKDFAYVYFRFITRGLQEGWFTAHPHEVVPGGLGGIESGLTNLKNGKASAVKYVFKIADTE